MPIDFADRRRSPRIVLDRPYALRTSRRIRVQMLDVSASGALLVSDEALPIGTTGRLRLLLGSTPFEAPVQVRREGESPVRRGRLAGVALGALQPGPQDALDTFLRRAGN